MEARPREAQLFKRELGYYEINWKLENFCFSLLDYGLEAKTGFFYLTGSMSTRWKLYAITYKDEILKNFVKLVIKRESSKNGPDKIWTQWKVWIKFTENKKVHKFDTVEFKHAFQKGGEYSFGKIPIGTIFDNFNGFTTNELEVKFLLLFGDQCDEQYETPIPIDGHLLSLSKDLKRLLDSGKNSDVLLKNNEVDIRAHKAILYYRNRVLAEKIESDSSKDVIDLSNVGDESLPSVVCYLYSSNFREFIRKPTFSKQELVQFLDIKEIATSFLLDKLHIHSKYLLNEFSKVWKINNYKNKISEVDCIKSTVMKGTEPFGLRLVFFPKAYDEDEKYVEVYVECDNAISVTAYIQISLMKGKYLCIKTLEMKCPLSTKYFGFEHFAKKDLVFNSLEDGTLYIGFKLRHCFDSKWATSLNYTNSQNDQMKVQSNHYQKLSRDMTRMFEEGKFADITIEFHSGVLQAHKCIVNIRSSLLARNLNRNTAVIRNVEPQMFRLLVHYLYSGVLKIAESRNILVMCQMAVKFNIVPLQNLCSDLLKRRMTSQTVVDILVFAHECENSSLKETALQFIAQNGVSEENWKQLMESHQSLYREVKRFLNKTCSIEERLQNAMKIE